MIHRTVTIVLVTACALMSAGFGQQSFEPQDEVTVLVQRLNVRDAPGTSAAVVGQVAFGMRARVDFSAPQRVDGYWWWQVRFQDGLTGWVAEGEPGLAYLGDGSDRWVVDQLDPFGNTGVWQQQDFTAALEIGLELECRVAGRGMSTAASGFATYPTSRCAAEHRLAMDRFANPAAWDLDDPVIDLLGSHQVGSVRVYFTSWSLSLLRGTAGTNMLNVYVQPAGEVPYLAFTINSQTPFGRAYDASTPDRLTATTRVYLPGDPNSSPSMSIEQVYAAEEHGMRLHDRRTVLHRDTAIVERLMDDPSLNRQAGPIDPDLLSQIVNAVSEIALDASLTEPQREARLLDLERRWDVELVTAAIRIMPVYDANSGRWQSFDRWIRDVAADTGVEAPLTHDPVASAVRMVFDPSVSTVARELGLDRSIESLLSW